MLECVGGQRQNEQGENGQLAKPEAGEYRKELSAQDDERNKKYRRELPIKEADENNYAGGKHEQVADVP